MEDQLIFISSAGDLGDIREKIRDDLESWLKELGALGPIRPYLWEDDHEDQPMFTGRMPAQEQLPDTAYSSVLCTICLFGEKCGLPLHDELPDHWNERIDNWRAGADGAGLIHPWPTNREEQSKVLENGGFPLTGTTFELISAFAAEQKESELFVAYVSSAPVNAETELTDIDFNGLRLWRNLTDECKSPDDRDRIKETIYNPQKHALLNLLKYILRNYGPKNWFASQEDMQKQVLQLTKDYIKKRLGFTSLDNPFKSTLEHWSLSDGSALPGRSRHLYEIPKQIKNNSQQITLLKGRSGCGKSSLMQRGVLSKLRDQGYLVLAVRPTDLESEHDKEDCLDVLFDLLSDTIGVNLDRSARLDIPRRARITPLAEFLTDALERLNQHLVLGLDQFEEVLDELLQFNNSQGRSQGWWLVMEFLSKLSDSTRFILIGTLESSRYETFKKLDIEKEIGLLRKIIDIDVNADDVAEIAVTGFRRAGIMLDAELVEEIKSKWEEFETFNDSKLSASPLPLACLWFAQTFQRFEDKARIKITSEKESFTVRAFRHSEKEYETLYLHEIEEGVSFENIIASLAEEAWLAAGKTQIAPEKLENDPDVLNTLKNLLTPLIALDEDGHKRLLSIPSKAVDENTKRLRKSLTDRRLLVPSNISKCKEGYTSNRLRLAHQSVIDRWPLASKWFELRQEYLLIESELRKEAKIWSKSSTKQIKKNRKSIKYAAAVLAENYWWNNNLEQEDEELRQYAIAVFKKNNTPMEVISTSIFKNRFVHIAARYHLIELLELYADIDIQCFSASNNSGEVPLRNAAWGDGPATKYLLSKNIQAATPNKNEWYPIEASIQAHANNNYQLLIEHIEDINMPVGPNGILMLHLAAWYGNLFVLDDLLKRGVDINCKNVHYRNALHFSVFSGKSDTFSRLLSKQSIDIDAEDEWKNTAIAYAAIYGSDDIIRIFLDSDEVSNEILNRVLLKKNTNDNTPLMLAAIYKQPDALKLLLKHCNPNSPSHYTDDGKNLLHLAVNSTSWETPSDDEKIRTRKTVELLLTEDGRLDPTEADKQGKTPFDLAGAYIDARRVIRRDKRMPTDYAKMTTEMRIEDLESRDSRIVLNLLRNAPQALTDKHGEENDHSKSWNLKSTKIESGLDILFRTKNIQVLTQLLTEKMINTEFLNKELSSFLDTAHLSSANELRTAILDRIEEISDKELAMSTLLDTCLRKEEKNTIKQLIDLGAMSVRGPKPLNMTVFHELILHNNLEKFKFTAQSHQLHLPLDAWNRRPSDLAPQKLIDRVKAMEDELFKPAKEVSTRQNQTGTKLHNLAREGNLRGFEIQVRGMKIPIPRNDDGHSPSDLAPEDKQKAFKDLENKYFEKEH